MLDLLDVPFFLSLILLRFGRLRFLLIFHIFEFIIIIFVQARHFCILFRGLRLNFFWVRHEIDVLVSLREVQKMKTTLDLVCFL